MIMLQTNTETLSTRSNVRFQVRPVEPTDAAALAAFFTHVSKEDLRFRFLSGMNKVNAAQISAMTNIDHDRTENFLAFDGDTIIASAMLATDETGKHGEVAMAIRADYKQRGISWTLLDHVAHEAKARGLETLESIETRDHHAAIELEREMGFVAEPCPGDAALVVLKTRLNRN